MEMEMHREYKIATIYLPSVAHSSDCLSDSLSSIYLDLQKQKIKPVVLISGTEKVYDSAKDLVDHNLN